MVAEHVTLVWKDHGSELYVLHWLSNEQVTAPSGTRASRPLRGCLFVRVAVFNGGLSERAA